MPWNVTYSDPVVNSGLYTEDDSAQCLRLFRGLHGLLVTVCGYDSCASQVSNSLIQGHPSYTAWHLNV